jgi:hypothetical protein
MRVLLTAVGNVEDLDINLLLAIISQYKRLPITEVEGAGEVTPSLVEVQVAAVGDVREHLHLHQARLCSSPRQSSSF